MAVIRFGRAAVLIAAVSGLGAASASAADPTPEEVLAGRGLVKDGKYFLLPEVETEVMRQLNTVLPLVDNLDVLFDQWAANENKKFMVAALNDEMAGCQAQMQNNTAMYGQVDRNPAIARIQRQELDQNGAWLRQYFGQLRNQRDLIQGKIAGPRIQQAHLEKVDKSREVFLKAYDEMTPSVTKLKAAYSEVAQDDQVANALKVLRQAKSVQMKLGPSEGIMKAMGRVNNAKNVMDPKYFKPAPFSPKKPPRTSSKQSRKSS